MCGRTSSFFLRRFEPEFAALALVQNCGEMHTVVKGCLETGVTNEKHALTAQRKTIFIIFITAGMVVERNCCGSRVCGEKRSENAMRRANATACML